MRIKATNLNPKWTRTTLGHLSGERGKSIEPLKTPDNQFELYSVPSFPDKKPEIVFGKDVGSNKQIVEERSVLLGKINPRINRVWVVGKFSSHMKIASTEWIVFPISEDIVSEFLCYFLQKNNVRDYLAHNASGVGGSLMRVKPSTLRDFPFEYPNTKEQRRIVAEIEKQFSRLEEGVNALKRVQTNLKRFRAAILKAACEGKLVETEAELHRKRKTKTSKLGFESGEQLLKRILDERRKKWQGRGKYKEPTAPDSSKLPTLPTSWSWVSWEMVLANEEGAFKRGPFGSALTKAIFVDKGFKVYEQYCPINDDCSFARYYITPEKFEELKAFEVKAGDYLISCSGVTLGRITRVPEKFERGIINQALLRVRLNESVIENKYFLHLFRSALFQKTLFDNSTGSAIPNVKGVKELKAMAIPLPPLAEQKRIVEEVERRLSVVEELESLVTTNLQRASRLRQSILQKAFEGELV